MVTDVIMPEMSGRVLPERVAERCPGLPVLYMSGYTDDAIVRHGLMGHLLEFIQKPFTPEALVRKVREVLDKNK
jgi:two-component system cell cycle sensor histidine kinase/response regulator CckA